MILICVNQEKKEENLLWSNPKPTSTLFCRPLKLQFTMETKKTILNEKTHFDKQIEKLQLLKTTIHMKNVFIQYSFLSMTMLDGYKKNTKKLQARKEEDKEARKEEDKEARKEEDKEARKEEDKEARKEEDKEAREEEDEEARKEEDKEARKEEDKEARKEKKAGKSNNES
ncbi:uncharacterized protein LOC136075837 [Hydra vulgaris]|uniref:Uncharacterized protein LOC136075837 n=1 Tax=Hydra vulgaris TaxID=6087 RepID=A0ABM4B905_HYDVU